jgi:hypothetical protein
MIIRVIARQNPAYVCKKRPFGRFLRMVQSEVLLQGFIIFHAGKPIHTKDESST